MVCASVSICMLLFIGHCDFYVLKQNGIQHGEHYT